MSAPASVRPKEAGAKAGPTPPPKRDMSIVPSFANLKEEDLHAILRAKRWKVVATNFMSDGPRISDSGRKCGFLAWVEAFTAGRLTGIKGGTLVIAPKGQSQEWTLPLTTSDVAKLLRCKKRQALRVMGWAVGQKFIRRKGTAGLERYRFQLARDVMENAENAMDADDIAAAQDGKKSKTQTTEKERVNEGGCSHPGLHVRFLELSGKVVKNGAAQEVARFESEGQERRFMVQNQIGAEAAVTSNVTENGDVILRVEASGKSRMTPEPVQKPVVNGHAAHSNGKAEAPRVAEALPVEVLPVKSDAAERKRATEEIIAACRLPSRGKIHVDREMAGKIVYELWPMAPGSAGPTPVSHFIEILDNDLQVARAKGKTLSSNLLPSVARKARETWVDGIAAGLNAPAAEAGSGGASEKPPMTAQMAQEDAYRQLEREVARRSKERHKAGAR